MKKRRILLFALALAMLLGLLPAATVGAEDGNAVDVVIVFDRSSSMDGDVLACGENHTHSSGCYQSKMSAARDIAKDCIDSILDGNSQAKVAIVSFAKDASVAYSFSRSKILLKLTLDFTFKSGKAANIEGGLVKATNYLIENGRAGAKKAIILISAGEPKYCNDALDEFVIGTGLFTTPACTAQTLDQAHLTRDFDVTITSVAVGAEEGGGAESLMMAVQNRGYYTAITADAGRIANGIFTEKAFDTTQAGSTWTVGFAKESLLPSDLPFMSYRVDDLPETGLLYDRSILNEDLSFDLADLPSGLRELMTEYNRMSAEAGKYPSSMLASYKTFINRVLPIDPPFNPALMAQYSASFTADKAVFDANMATAFSAFDAAYAGFITQKTAEYVQGGMTQEGAEALVSQRMAGYIATGSSGDADFDEDYKTVKTGIDESDLVLDYTLPDSKYYMAGYAQDLFAKGYINTPYARAVYIDDNTGRGGIILVALETIGLSRADVNKVRDSLAKFKLENNIREINVLASHNHAAIDTMGLWGPIVGDGKDDGYMELVLNAIETAARNAFAARKDGRLYVGTADAGSQTGYAEALVEDTRYPYVTDNAEIITRFRFVPNDNSKELYIIHFGVHLEALYGVNYTVSEDFLDPFGKYLDDHAQADFIYFTGAIGGLIRTTKNQTITGGFVPRNDRHKYWKITEITGKRLGELVCGIVNDTELVPKLNAATTTFEAELDNYLFTLMSLLGIINTRIYFKDVQTGLVNTAAAVTSFETLSTASLNAMATYALLKAQGRTDEEILTGVLSSFGSAYYNAVSESIKVCARSEMSYYEFYGLDGQYAKGVVFMPGEIFAELVYGGMLEGGYNDWSLDPHNPTAAPIDTLAEIAESTGRDYGEGYEDLLVFGQANDMIGYIVAPNDFLLSTTLPYIENNSQGPGRSHYEETNSTGPRTAYTVADTFEKLMAKTSLS